MAQLRAAGLSYDAIRRLGRDGMLHEIFRSVFKVGPKRLDMAARRHAAALAVAGVVSHFDAAALLKLPAATPRAAIHVTTTRQIRPISGLVIHRVRALRLGDVCKVDGIPCTTRPRTYVDLADEMDEAAYRTAVHEGEIAKTFDLDQVKLAVGRANGRDLKVVRAVIVDYTPHTKAEFEPLLERVASRAGLTNPLRNFPIDVPGETFEADRYYPEHNLILEADSRLHQSHRKFQTDRRRDRLIHIHRGITTFRYTWRDVTAGADNSVVELVQFVAHRAAAA